MRLIPSVMAVALVAGAVMSCGGDSTGPATTPASPDAGTAIDSTPTPDSPTTTGVDTAATVVSTSATPGTTTTGATGPETTSTTPATTTSTAIAATSEETAPTTTAAAEPTTTTTEPLVTTTEVPATITTGAPVVVEISDDVPDIEMFDAATGELVSLRSVVKGEKPLMFWFWSPF